MTASAGSPEVADNGYKVPGKLPLPPAWVWARLSDVSDVVMGNSPPSSSYNTSGRGVPLINGPTEFGIGQLDHPRALQYTDAPTRFCETGDLLVCVRGSTTGRTNVASFRACIGRGVAAIRAGECQAYVNCYVASHAALLLSIGTGSTFPNITRAQLQALAVPLPPLSEQARLVAAIEQALAEIDSGVAALVRARVGLVQMRASVLQAAVSGELTRGSRPATEAGESGANLLRRIAAERQRSTESTQFRTSAGQIMLFPPAIDGDAQELDSPAASSRRPLPENWAWATFGQICEIQLGQARNPANRAGRYASPYLRAANITEDGLDLSDVLQMDFPPRERERYSLRKGDLVVSEASGSPEQVGKPALWNNELPICCFQNTVIRLRPVVVLSEYVLVLLQHSYFNRVFVGLAAGVGINHLGATRLAQITIPVAPLSEQAEIVAEVAEQLAVAQASRTAIDTSLAHARQLRDSVLAKAFSGQLVESQPSAEPAALLIERVKAQRTEAAAGQLQVSPRRIKQMTLPPKRRPILDVLREHPGGITPEELFAESNYSADAIDDFYAALARIATEITQEKPSDGEALQWPACARILLRPRVV